jgi:hypothetical protein
MEPSLWRIYSLLAGDLDEIVSDALEWRTAFGMYLWYRHPSPVEGAIGSEDDDLRAAVRDFEAAAKRHGSCCYFRPVPPHIVASQTRAEQSNRRRPELTLTENEPLAALRSKPRAEPYDLQFNAIRTAVGLIDWHDFSHFDYMTHSPRPFDVAVSWHFSAMLLALGGGDSSAPGFQLLTQQYCLALELAGLWVWAVHVALYVTDQRARHILVRGLLQRNAAVPESLQEAPRREWPGVPTMWLRRAEALRCEAAQDWPGAVSSWLQCGFAKRALLIEAAYLHCPAVLWHAAAPFRRGPLESILLEPMSQPARWLLNVLEELAPIVERSDEAWAQLGKELLAFMREWGAAKEGQYQAPGDFARTCKNCISARQYLVGLPW